MGGAEEPQTSLGSSTKDLQSLSRLIAFLERSELDFAVRCAGMGSASAKDVLISMSAFDSFEFDEQSETITIGAGQTWAEIDVKMEKFASGYAGMTPCAPADLTP